MLTDRFGVGPLFVSETDGALYDTRDSDWANNPVRPNYARHNTAIESSADLRATLRAGESTRLGCYPLYFITSDGAALSFDSVRSNLRLVLESIRDGARGYPSDGWRVEACAVNYEDSALLCDHSGESIPSAYSDE